MLRSIAVNINSRHSADLVNKILAIQAQLYWEELDKDIRAQYSDEVIGWITSLIRKGAIEYTPAIFMDTLLIAPVVLKKLAEKGQFFYAGSQHAVVTLPEAEGGQCHRIAHQHYRQHPGQFHYFIGVTSGEHYHSWLMDPKHQVIYEPTPYERRMYYGVHVQDVDTFFARR